MRQPSRFLDHVCPDGTTAYPAAAGRYVLYVSYACPWAHRAVIVRLFARLDLLDRRLADRRYLMGPAITEVDWWLFTTLVRFDPVYVGHFKTNLRRIADYPNLEPYLRDLYQHPGIAETVRLDQAKLLYYGTHRQLNPSGIIPAGPVLDWDAPHGREALGG